MQEARFLDGQLSWWASTFFGESLHSITFATPESISVLPTTAPAAFEKVDHVYYINLEEKIERRNFMEQWLSSNTRFRDRYQRVAGMRGEVNSTKGCSPKKSSPPQRCAGIKGLALTNTHIMESLNTTGFTLVLEDDHKIIDVDALYAAVRTVVPADWDTIRFDCWGCKPASFLVQDFKIETRATATTTQAAWRGEIFQTAHVKEKTTVKNENRQPQCSWFCGGTHAVLFRSGRSILRLKKLYLQEGSTFFEGIDCLLTTGDMKNYCVNMPGVLVKEKTLASQSSIPKRLR